MEHYKELFTQGRLGRRITKNRIVMAPMGEDMANADGSVSKQVIAYYAERAKGGTGVIIPGVLSVDYPYGKTTASQMRIDNFKYIKELSQFADQIHRYDSLLIPQIHHAGGQTYSITTEGNVPVCVSADIEVEHALMKPYRMMEKQKELTIDEIHVIRDKFITAAKYCQLAGCDGIEIHSAHGYLVNQFLSLDTNARTDEYGVSLENRMRFGVEIITGIRAACGPDFIIGARIPGFETVQRGLSQDDCVKIAQTYEQAGCDFLHVSCGCVARFSQLEETQGYEQGWRVKYATNIKKAVNIPVIAVGALREPQVCENILANKEADFVALGRPLICDPYWGEKAKAGKANEIRKCISCMDGCIDSLGMGRAISCTLNPVVGYEADFAALQKSSNPKHIVIVGGGPAGMQAAITAAQIGNRVTLLEKSSQLGGQLNIAHIPPKKGVIRWALEWQSEELKRQGVDIKLNFTADAENIKALHPDLVFVATGAAPAVPPIPGIENGIQAWDILYGKIAAPKNKNIAIIGGGIVGCEMASLLTEKENKVTIIEMLPEIAAALNAIHRADMLLEFEENHVDTLTNTAVKSIEKDNITIETDHKIQEISIDEVILATGQRPYGSELIEQLSESGIEVRSFGDVKRPGKIINATHDAFWAAMSI